MFFHEEFRDRYHLTGQTQSKRRKLVSNDSKTFCGICWQHKPTVNMNSYMPPSQINSQMNSAGGTAGSYRWFIFAFSHKTLNKVKTPSMTAWSFWKYFNKVHTAFQYLLLYFIVINWKVWKGSKFPSSPKVFCHSRAEHRKSKC